MYIKIGIKVVIMATQPAENNLVSDLNVKSPFVESGSCSDEIVLMFDDRSELFVSQNFLSYASPVFEAMFQKGFKEIEERVVRLRGKDSEDMLELLKCLHPSILTPVDRTNALRLLALADEYQMSVIKERCEKVLFDWLQKEKEAFSWNSNGVSSSRRYQRAEVCLKILTLAIMVNHDSLLKAAKSVLSVCRYKAFTGVYFTSSYENADEDPVKHRENCAKLFAELPNDMKISILTTRLQVCDNC